MKHKTNKILSAVLGAAMLFSSVPATAAADTLYVDKKADVAFVIDVTGSMGSAINGVKNNISEFISLLDGEGVDVRVRFVKFGDITCGEPTECSSWYSDVTQAQDFLSGIEVDGGGDTPESTIDGIGEVLNSSFGFRSGASKFCVVLTDAGIKFENNKGLSTEEEVVERLSRNNINTSVITDTSEFGTFRKYVSTGHATDGSDNGILADIYGSYSILLKNFADSIISSLDIVKVSRMEPNYGEVGVKTPVEVTAKGMVYNDDFAVTVGGIPAEVTSRGDTYFGFLTPDSLPVGKYDVVVKNGSGISTVAGVFEYRAPASPDAPVLNRAAPSSFMEFTDTEITITGKNFGTAPAVTLDGKDGKIPLTIVSASDKKIVCSTGTGVSGGIYGMTITNDKGLSLSVEDYFNVDYTPIPDPPKVTNISPDTFFELTDTSVSISGRNFDAPEVYIGSEKVEVESSSATNVTIKTGEGFSAGTYDLTLVNSDGVKLKYYGRIKIRQLPYCARIVSAEPGDEQVKLTWDTIEDAGKYKAVVYKDGVFVKDYAAGRLTSCTISGLENDVEYRFAVLSYMEGIWAKTPSYDLMYPATPRKDDPPPMIDSPVITELTPDDGAVKITWGAVEGAGKYKAQAHLASGRVKEYSAGRRTSCTISGLTNGTEYGFCVLAYKDGLWTEVPAFADMKKATPNAAAPTPGIASPVITELTPDDGAVRITWGAVEGAGKYKAQAYLASGKVKEYAAGKNTSCTISGLTNGTEYGFCVLAYKDGLWTEVPAFGEMKKATPNAVVPTITIASPVITELTPDDGAVRITWGAVEGAGKYKAQAHLASGRVKEYAAGVNTSCTISGLTNGTEYGFCVLAYKDGLWTEVPTFGTMKTAAPQAKVNTVLAAEIVSLTPTSGGVKLTWSTVDGAGKYRALAFLDGKQVKQYSAGRRTYCTISGLSSGKTYAFCVQTYKDGIWSDIPSIGSMKTAIPG